MDIVNVWFCVSVEHNCQYLCVFLQNTQLFSVICVFEGLMCNLLISIGFASVMEISKKKKKTRENQSQSKVCLTASLYCKKKQIKD